MRLMPFCNIFATHVGGTEVGNRRRLPVFSSLLWNHFDDALFQAPKTTNCCGFHHALQAIFQCNHPTTWKLFDGLLNDIGIHRLTVQNVNTRNVDFSKRKYAIIAERLAQKVALYIHEPDKLHYLRATAHMQVPR